MNWDYKLNAPKNKMQQLCDNCEIHTTDKLCDWDSRTEICFLLRELGKY